MEIDENLKVWAQRFGLTESTSKSLADKGFTSTLTLARLTKELIDEHFEDLVLAQKLMLKEAVSTLQEETGLRQEVQGSYNLSGSNKLPQQSSSSFQTSGSQSGDDTIQENSQDGHTPYEGPERIEITGCTEGEHKNINLVGYQNVQHQKVGRLEVGVAKVHVQHVHEEGPTGILTKKSVGLKIQEAEDDFVETESYRRIESKLKKHGLLTICGASGEGKTTMCLILASRYKEMGYEIVFVTKIELFDLAKCIESFPKLFLIIDDIFGNEGTKTAIAQVEEALKQLSTCYRHTQNADMKDKLQNMVILFSSKSYYFKGGVSRLSADLQTGILRQETIVDLTSDEFYRYSAHDIKAIFEHYRKCIHTVCSEDLQGLLAKSHPLFGFPMVCKLIFRQSPSEVGLAEFYRNTLTYLRREMKDLLSRNDDITAVLILMFLCEEMLDLSMIQNPGRDEDFEKRMKSVVEFCGSRSITCSRSGMYEQAKNFRGTIFAGRDTVSFAHVSIYDACALELFETDPDFVLEHCSDSFLYERLKANVAHSTEVDNKHDISISINYFQKIAGRLAKAVTQGQFAKSLTHPIIEGNEGIVCKMLETLKKTSTPNPNWIHRKDQDKGFLFWVLHGPRPDLITHIERELKCTFTESEIAEGVLGCVQTGNLDLLKLLLGRVDRKWLDENKHSLLDSAVQNRRDSVAAYLREH